MTRNHDSGRRHAQSRLRLDERAPRCCPRLSQCLQRLERRRMSPGKAGRGARVQKRDPCGTRPGSASVISNRYAPAERLVCGHTLAVDWAHLLRGMSYLRERQARLSAMRPSMPVSARRIAALGLSTKACLLQNGTGGTANRPGAFKPS